MKISKNQFLIFLAITAIVAGILAYILEPLMYTNDGITPDAFFLVAYVITFTLLMENFASAAIMVIYGGSILFCFFYIFIAPLEAPLVMLFFFWPALKWQKNEISILQLSGIMVALVIGTWWFLGRPAVIFLLFPTCHILAARFMGKKVRTRYSKDVINLRQQFSHKQQKMRSKLDGKKDWWYYLQPELEAMPDKIKAAWSEQLHPEKRQFKGADSVLNRHLLTLQHPNIMSKALTNIKKRDESFDSELFLKRADKVFWKIQKAWYSQKIIEIQSIVSDGYYEQLKCQIDEQQAIGVIYKYSKMTIDETRIAQVNTDSNFDVIHVFLRGSSQDALIDLETKEVLAENDEARHFCEYWTFARKPSAKTLTKPGLLEGNCPSCGAPIEIGQSTVCPICNSFIRSGFYDWVLAKVTQACEWEYSESNTIPNWRKMLANDANFSLQQIEDRGSVIFWMQRLAERTRSINPIKRYSTAQCCSNQETIMGDHKLRNRDFMENVALASVKLKGFKLAETYDRLYLLVVWSGVPVMLDSGLSAEMTERYTAIERQVFVLIRMHGKVTNQNTTMTSAHCPNCGAQLSSTYTVSCEYCNTVLNEGGAGWILEKIIKEQDDEFIEATKIKKEVKVAEDIPPEYRSALDVLTIIVQVLLADGKIDKAEIALLKEYGAKYNICNTKINSIVKSVRAGNIHIPAPQNSSESWNILMSASRMALSDDELSPDEEHSLHVLAQYLGYSKADVHRSLKMEKQRRHQTGKTIVEKSTEQ